MRKCRWYPVMILHYYYFVEYHFTWFNGNIRHKRKLVGYKSSSSQSSQLVPRWPSFGERKILLFSEKWAEHNTIIAMPATRFIYYVTLHSLYLHAHNNVMWCILLLLMVCSTVQGMFRENAYVRIKTEQYRLRLNCRFRGIRTCTLRAYLSSYVYIYIRFICIQTYHLHIIISLLFYDIVCGVHSPNNNNYSRRQYINIDKIWYYNNNNIITATVFRTIIAHECLSMIDLHNDIMRLT